MNAPSTADAQSTSESFRRDAIYIVPLLSNPTSHFKSTRKRTNKETRV